MLAMFHKSVVGMTEIGLVEGSDSAHLSEQVPLTLS